MMQTRCTACGTTFRITAEQLKLRQGRVRCGRCHFVFNALEALVVDEAQPASGEPQNGKANRPAAPPPRPAAPAMPVPPASAPALAATPAPAPGRAAGIGSAKSGPAGAAPQSPAFQETPAKAAAAPPPSAVAPATSSMPAAAAAPPAVVPVAKPSNGNGNGNGKSRDSTTAPKTAVAAPVPAPPPEPAPAAAPPEPAPPPAPKWTPSDGDFALTSIDEIVYATDTPRAAGDHEFELPEIRPLVIPHTMAEPEPILHETPRRRSWLWTLGVILALQALVMQAVYVYRVDLTVLQPDLRPLLADACAQIGCDLPLPQQIKLIDIEASDLNPDPAARNHLRLSATLKNRAPFAQQLPDVELTLTDTLDRPLASRVLTPADYLPAKRSAAAGFAAGEDLAFSLPIEVVGAAASGYRLYLFYP